MVMAEHAAEVTSREEDRAGTIVTLYAWLFAKIEGYDIDFGGLGADEADAGCFPGIHSAASWAKIAISEVGIGLRSLL